MESSIGESWKTEAIDVQYQCLLYLGDRDFDQIDYDVEHMLSKKVSYACFKKSLQSIENGQKELIQKIVDPILKQSGETVYFATIFIILKEVGENEHGFCQVPVFKILNCKYDVIFVDTNGRIYKSWSNYMKDNVLPPCEFCYPCNGKYTYDQKSKVAVDFAFSPATKKKQKILSHVDKAASALKTLGIFVPLAFASSLATPVAAVAIGTTLVASLYTSGRAISRIHDRRIHCQSISLTDSEARSYWGDILQGGLSAGSAGLFTATSIAKSGSKLEKWTQNSLKWVNKGRGAVDAAQTIDKTVHIQNKGDLESIMSNYFWDHTLPTPEFVRDSKKLSDLSKLQSGKMRKNLKMLKPEFLQIHSNTSEAYELMGGYVVKLLDYDDNPDEPNSARPASSVTKK